MTQPITIAELADRVQELVWEMPPYQRQLWTLISIEPEKWRLSPWGDEGHGFWAVGLLGRQVIWFNDIEDGFDISEYTQYGTIGEYLCSQL